MKKPTLREEAEKLRTSMIEVGDVVIIKKKAVKPEFHHDLRFSVYNGFGMHPNLKGTALLGKWLVDGEDAQGERMSRHDIDWMATARYRREQAKAEAEEKSAT